MKRGKRWAAVVIDNLGSEHRLEITAPDFLHARDEVRRKTQGMVPGGWLGMRSLRIDPVEAERREAADA